ncbi:hypothetical protein ACXYTJ_14090 [Gilvimarinus sp. F26214L]|uniref:hypothetical protein n=1 Tax=Gilvimarinus sp. DZF01 TaxID=3461371 RepID=UPI0040462D87
MNRVYIVGASGETSPMERVECTNEDQELQTLLQGNPELLPGDQINPEEPRRWLLIKREMPVPDPATGATRWSVDFLFADQDGVPTFIECKRYQDSRARREVVGQMIEYAANGHYYWAKEDLRTYAEQSAQARGSSLDAMMSELGPTCADTPDGYFEVIQQNLREAQIRLVFFLEKAPAELKSVVDFLNRQMERSEVLLVEAKQYSKDSLKIVVPTLFGYTEAARQAKRRVMVRTESARRKWDRERFFASAAEALTASEVAAIQQFFDRCLRIGCEVSWGTGAITGSFNVKITAVARPSLITITTNGDLYFNFGALSGEGTLNPD